MDLLSALNAVALPKYQQGLIDQRIYNVLWLQRLKSRVKKAKFDSGGNLIMGVETGYPIPGGPVAEGSNVMTPGSHTYQQMSATVHRVMNVAGMHEDVALRLSKAPSQSFADMPNRLLKNCGRGMDVILNLILHGDGTGRLAQVKSLDSGTGTGAGVITVDNNRTNFGYPAEAMVKVGMRIDIISWGGSTKITDALVSAVARTVTTADAEEGTITYSGGTYTADPADNDIVFIHGAASYSGGWTFHLPEGIMSLCDDGATTAGPGAGRNGSWRGTSFQGLDRTAAAGAHLKARIYKAGDWATGGVDGTAATYYLDDVESIFADIEDYGEGDNIVTALAMTPKTQRSLKRKTQMEMSALYQVGDGEIIPGRYVRTYNYKGRKVPILEIPTLPERTMYFLDENQITWQELLPIQWRAYHNQKPWFDEPGGRALQFEAWMQAIFNLTVERCTGFGRLEDIDTDE